MPKIDCPTETVRELSLVKGPHRYVISYVPHSRASEEATLREIIRMADDSDLTFDYLDAQVFTFRMGLGG